VPARDAQGQETVKFRPDVALRLRRDNSGLKGPEIEIMSVDGLLAGTYSFDLTRDGFRVRFPAPAALLKQVTWGRKKTNTRRDPAIGFEQAPRGFRQAPQGFEQAPQGYRQDTQGYGRAPQGFAKPPQDLERAATGFGQSSGGFRHDPKSFGQSSSRGLGPASQGFGGNHQPARMNGGRFYGSATTGPVPPRPVPTPISTGRTRAPVPNNAFQQNNYRQPQGGFGQGRGGFNQSGGQLQGPNKNKRDKGSSGCCSGGDSSPGPTSTYERLGMSEAERKKSQKRREKMEKEERKRAKKMMKGQKKRKQGGYSSSDGMYAEKSGFDDDERRKSNWCCC
jgi:hypothetical protein